MKNVRNLLILLSLVVATGCTRSQEAVSSQLSGGCGGESCQVVPGAVQYVWEEPTVDVIEVPPGLDPEGIYYRPAHQAVVEIRQGRWKYYKNQ